jgi:hypothetical protein
MLHVELYGARVVTFVGGLVASGMPEHERMYAEPHLGGHAGALLPG